ncbi:WD40 repeat domain-containing protein [Notoacmeibacter sp. MSK16QG-6]|uniref:WD40 repeat domain-containing protein n=1 Tax=Notoacmeibacter sp. MSK16QG-6 TaxID=2957982 RepID=UPI00209FA1C2|nr:WD40 repeat domain-containing protein [Notoacmeibacter sp. MSK16QG-6]MCP1200318.1 WD40 repeat domain-containing protein [Notoacmeibacter sp. MSK16QG-6]
MPSIAPLDIDGHVGHVGWLGETAFFGDADGVLHRLGKQTGSSEVHDGLLCLAIDPKRQRALTGGEDGRVVATNADGASEELALEKGKWIGAVAAAPDGTVAYAHGKFAKVLLKKGPKSIEHERSVEALAFAPKGLRLACSHYNGVSLHFPATDSLPTVLGWEGAHLLVTFAPGGDSLITAMQEPALHGWRMADSRHMRMEGYPTKVKSLSWSAKGKWLASSGANAAIVWPFQGKDGPMGKAPLELGTRADSLVTAVACHPTEQMVAIGYQDGMVLAVRFEDAKEALLRRPGKGLLTAMEWDQRGKRLAFASEAGDCGIVDIGD